MVNRRVKIGLINVFKGCPERDRFSRLTAFMREKSLDFLGLNELNGWERNGFGICESFAKSTGLTNYIFGRSINSPYHVALFSHFPFETSQVISEGIRTALVKAEVRVGDVVLNLLVTHLHPKNENLRLDELSLILDGLNISQSTVLMGDMNSLSPEDVYDESALLEEMRRLGVGKFGTDRLRTDVVRRIVEHGFVDAVRQFSRDPEYSAPTDYNRDEMHFTKLRLDYIFISSNLRRYLKSASIVRNEVTQTLSDHFPVFAEFELSKLPEVLREGHK